MLYLIMLMSDIDFSRIGAKVSDKGPPSRWQARGPSLFGWTMETMRNATKTRSEFEQADGIRGSETPERMAALREAQPFVDQGGHPLILERDKRTDAKLPRNRLGFPRVPAQQIGQRERLGHADRSAREESLERKEVLGVRGIGLIATFEDRAADEVRSRCDRLSLGHGRALRTRAGGYSFCREIIRQMTKFPAAVEIGGEGAAQGSLQSRVYPHRRQMTLQFRSKVGPPQTSHGSSVFGPAVRSEFVAFGAAVMPMGHGDLGRKASRTVQGRSPGKSSRATIAALRPGAPVTPPPGWALLPQRYSPRTGVR